MTAKEACVILLNEFTQSKVLQCREYNELFVFMVVPKTFDETKSNGTLMDCLWSVNKKTGEINVFKPFDISLSDYNNGQEIKDFNL